MALPKKRETVVSDPIGRFEGSLGRNRWNPQGEPGCGANSLQRNASRRAMPPRKSKPGLGSDASREGSDCRACHWLPCQRARARKSDVIRGRSVRPGPRLARKRRRRRARRWLDGGFGKLREGGDANGPRPPRRAEVASADLAWKPQFGWNFSGLVSVTWQPDVSPEVGLSEAYLLFRSNPAPVRFEARARVFWPPISLEHEGSNWLVTDTITLGGQFVGSARRSRCWASKASSRPLRRTPAGAHRRRVPARRHVGHAAQLSRVGTARRPQVATNTDFPLPPLERLDRTVPGAAHQPVLRGRRPHRILRPGRLAPARCRWRSTRSTTTTAGTGRSSYEMQTSWRTRFWNLGVMASLGASTTARSQVMWGNTLVGPDTPWGIPVDVDFTAAYLLLTREAGPGKLEPARQTGSRPTTTAS